MKNMNLGDIFFTFVCIGIPGMMLVVLLACAIFTSGKADYCYVKHAEMKTEASGLQLYQHVPYREDRYIGTFKTIADAKEAADVIKCEVK